MRSKVLITSLSILTIFLIFIVYLSIYGIKTDNFNTFINNKVKEYNPNLKIKLDEVFIKLNLSEKSVNINTKNPSFVLENSTIKISNIDINLNIFKFIQKENSIKNIRIQSLDNSIKSVTLLLNSINYDLSRYIFFSQIKSGLINFEIETQFDLNNENEFNYKVLGFIKEAKFNLIGYNSLDKINFDFEIKKNFTEIKNLSFNYQNLKLSSTKLNIIKEKNGDYYIKGDIENDKAAIDPSLLVNLANFKQDYLSDKEILLKTKNSFSFQLNPKNKIQNFELDSIINFDEIHFNNKYQNIIFLQNGKINAKYKKNKLFADLKSNFSFIGQKDLENKNNILKLTLKKEKNKNTKIDGNISNKKELLDPKIYLNLLKLDNDFISDDKINIATDSEFSFEIDKNNKLKEYLVNSNLVLDKLTPNKSLNNLLYLKNLKTNLTLKNGNLKIDLNSNYSFFNQKYNNADDNNLFSLKFDNIDKNSSKVEIFLNTKNNKINTKEFKNLFNIETKLINDQIVNLNSNFFINFSIKEKNKIKNLNIKSELDFDSLKVTHKSNQIKKYFEDYQNKLILKNPKILIDYSNNILDFQLNGKYTLKNKYEDIFIKAKGKQNNFEIYSLLNLNANNLNLNEIEYFKKANVPSNLEFLVSYNNNKPILKKINITENQNRFKLSNVHFSKDFKIIKFDEVNLNYINKNKILNNLKIKRNSNNYLISGNNYDVENILETLLKNNNKNKLSKFFTNINTSLIFDINKLYLEKESYMYKLSGEIDIKNNNLFMAKLNANLNRTNKISYSFRTTARNEKITNILIQEPKPFINNYKFIKGFEEGVLNLNSTKIEKTSRSKLKITNFKVKEVPILAKILTLASLQGIADLLTGEGIRFDKFEMDFKTKNNLTKIEEIYAIGPSISIMMDGYIEKDEITSLRGTLVPATTINKTIAKIPLLGDLLVGNKMGEGVFGVSFKIKGPPNNLKSTVNPIKTLTPRFITRTIETIKGN